MYNPQLYIPRIAVIQKIKELGPHTRLFRIVFKEKDAQLLDENEFLPGQFVQVTVFGVGEIPISIASSPMDEGYLELSIRRVGFVTDALHRLKPGEEIGIRGPYGNHFPIEDTRSKDFLFVGGGCGLAGLRALMKYMLNNRAKFPRLTLLYGARTSRDILFKDELYSWRQSRSMDVSVSVDHGPAERGCEVGPVTTLFKRFDNLRGTKVFICGPPLMLHSTISELLALGVEEADIILSLERYMKCGVGKCGHCYIKDKYVCTDGPIFSYDELKRIGVDI